MTDKPASLLDPGEIVRYVINGIVATGVHFCLLVFNLQVLEIPSAGLANMLAAVLAIGCSFIGSRYFVYRHHSGSMLGQARKFYLLYAAIACLHGLVLYCWTDLGGLDYRPGFLLATGLQVLLSYWGNKLLVFRA